MSEQPSDVPGYITKFPPSTRKLLRQLRSLIRSTVPKAKEGISYGIPMLELKQRKEETNT